MGIFFDDDKPKVTEEEFRKARQAMRGSGLGKKEADDVEQVFRGDLESGNEKKHKGIDEEELGKGIDWLKENKGSHSLSDDEIAKAEKALRNRL